MKSDTKERIYQLCAREQGIQPRDIVRELGITNAAVHRHLRALEAEGKIEKRGKAPRVFYLATKGELKQYETVFPEQIAQIIDQDFCYFLPNGKELSGVEAFLCFLQRTDQDSAQIARAKEYIDIMHKAYSFRDKDGLIDGSKKLEDTFSECIADKVYYSDFYSLPKYGKTRLGQYLLHGKSGQNSQLIATVAKMTEMHLKNIISKHKIEALCYIPHSIPRKISFLKEYKYQVAVPLPELQIAKVYSGEVPIAQKSLSKLSERIENARETIYVLNTETQFKRILIIDDALGSGATINEVAKKLMQENRVIFAYAIVGSYKGFEVLHEI